MKKLIIVLLIAAFSLPAFAQKDERVLPYDALIRSVKVYAGQRDKDWDRMIELLNQAIDNYPNPVEAYFFLGQIYADKGEYVKMMENFSKFHQVCDSARANNDKDLVKRCENDDMPQLIEDSKQSELSNRLDVGLRNLRQADSLGDIADTVSNDSLKADLENKVRRLLEFSEGAFNEALIISDTIPQVWNNLGIIQKKRGNPEEALSMYNRGYQLDSTRSLAVFDMATLHFDQGNYDESAYYYGRFAELDSLNAKVAYINQAMAYQASQNLEGLKNALDNVLKIDPNDADMRYQRGMYYIQRSNDQALRDSLALLDSMVQADPNNSEAQEKLDDMVERRENIIKQAIEDFQVATESNPADDIAWYWLGTSAFFVKDTELATKAYEKCVEVNENSKDCWCQLALIYTRAGQREKAEEANEKCESLE